MTPDYVVQAPGRDMWIAARVCNSQEFAIHAPDIRGGRTVFSSRSAKLKRTVLNRPLPRWARYPAGVVVALYSSGFDQTGFDAVIAGEEPEGPRYDHAMGTVIAALLYTLHDRPYTAERVLEIVERVRREYIEG